MQYLENTHAETHTEYSLKIREIFEIQRESENGREKNFNGHKRMLLWHGSRLTNFVGILSQGLRIAPPEAPVTGYMFGKGVYFADMVSKSANYCNTNRRNPIGMLLLCEVMIGNEKHLTSADESADRYIDHDKFHSTKGLGMTAPDPKDYVELDDGVIVPLGRPVKQLVDNSSLLYNEYIVYRPEQIKMRYLIKTTFEYK